jgi:hypothetical protein
VVEAIDMASWDQTSLLFALLGSIQSVRGARVAGESRRNALCHYQSADLRAKLAAASIAVDAPIGQKALFFGQKRCGETFCSNLFEVRLPNDELTIVCTVSKVDPRCKIRSWLQAWQRAGSSIR